VSVAIVTGAGSGIGRATAVRLARAGHAVACVDRDGASANETAVQIVELGATAVGVPCDVADDDSCAAAVRIAAGLGDVAVLCNIAGVSLHSTGVLEASPDEWDRVMAVNVRGIYSMTRHAVPHMRSRRKGVVINAASVHAYAAQAGCAPYAASKGAIVALTRQLAVDLTPLGIRVVAIAPGSVDTPMSRSAEAATGLTLEELGFSDDPFALGRIGSPDEIAAAFEWVASDQASFVNGTTMIVDGGLLAALGTSRRSR
jgi:3-oxoacyl-[acyl-carrier protein] reductase